MDLQNLIAQTELKSTGYYDAALDGIWGPISKRAAGKWFTALLGGHQPQAPVSESYIRHLVAQEHLAKAGLYHGKQDGIWGSLSQAAATAWAANQTAMPPAPLPPPDNRNWNLPYDVAKNHLGVREIPGKENHPLILRWLRKVKSWVSSEETAWCSAFVNHCAEEAGYESTGALDARSWLKVGQPVLLNDARKGDVVILWRVSQNSWQGHVAFLDHHNPTRGLLYLLGGNQNDEVNITAYGTSRLLGVRRLRSLDRLQGATANRYL